jgi:oligopeptide/dipeptide ABC transporter ATP-binding protein
MRYLLRARGWIAPVIRRPIGAIASVGVLVIAVIAVVAPSIWGAQAEAVDVVNAYLPPSAEHWFGTDSLGRDVLLRTLVATRLSVNLMLATAAIGLTAGILLGVTVVMLKGLAHTVGARIIDALLAFPPLLVALVIVAVMGPGVLSAVISIGVAISPGIARVTAALTAGVSGREFVLAAQLGGVGRWRIVRSYLGRNIGDPLAVQAAVALNVGLIGVSSLSFLGMGVQPPSYDWGRMLTTGIQDMYTAPATVVAPAIAVVFTGVCVALTGDLIATLINPRQRGGAAVRRASADVSDPASDPRAGSAANGASVSGTAVSVDGAAASQTALDHATARDGESARDHGLAPDGELGPLPRVADDPDGEARVPVLAVSNLQVQIPTARGVAHPVRDATFAIYEGETVGLVGESGSGKSFTGLALADLIEKPSRVRYSSFTLSGRDVRELPQSARKSVFGSHIGMVFQQPFSALNPALRLGLQLTEGIRKTRKVRRRPARRQAVDTLGQVQIADPARRLRQYSFELSGGMLQRVVISMALMARPKLIIADEPTTALDVTVQAQVLSILRRLNNEDNLAILLISHDLKVITWVCDRVLVMYAGQIVEDITTADLERGLAAHPYTRALMAAVPTLGTDPGRALYALDGQPPPATDTFVGCPFADRCPFATDTCRSEPPPFYQVHPGQWVRCFYPRLQTQPQWLLDEVGS